jgi:hypothetical protein
MPIFRNYGQDRFANDFFCLVTKDPFRALVPVGDDAIQILGDDGIVRRLDNGGQSKCGSLDRRVQFLRTANGAKDLRRAIVASAVCSIATSTVRFTRAANRDFCFVHNLEQIARSRNLTRKNLPSKGKKPTQSDGSWNIE